MKKVLILTLCAPALLFSCKSSQLSRAVSDEVIVTDKGYMYGYVPGSANTISTETEKDNTVSFRYEDLAGGHADIKIRKTSFIYPKYAKNEIGTDSLATRDLLLYAMALKKYAVENGYDSSYALLANMGQLSNTSRLYLINLSTLEIISKGLVSHGRGKGYSVYSKQYSNEPGSNCTSLGKYKIMAPYNGAYGYSYRIEGLESTNNNALNRGIVIHTMGCIPDTEHYAPACITEGCPAVSRKYFSSLKPVIESRKAPMLLWIFDSLLQEAVIDHSKNGNGLVVSTK